MVVREGSHPKLEYLNLCLLFPFPLFLVFSGSFMFDAGFDLVDVDPTKGDKDTLLGKGLNLLATGLVMLRVTGLSTLAYGFFSLGLVLVFIDDHTDLLDCATMY